MLNIFERASIASLRFSSGRGQITTEDLWNLDLEDLDKIARRVNKELKDSGEESFIEERPKTDVTNQLRLDILKHVIKSKQTAAAAATTRATNRARREQLEEILLRKEVEALDAKSVDEIKAELAELSTT